MKTTSGILLDRFIYTTIAYHSFLLKSDLSFIMPLLEADSNFLLPDAIVMMTADKDVIKQRFKERDKCQWNGDQVTLDYPIKDRYQWAFSLTPEIPVIEIDTTELLPEAACEKLFFDLNNKLQEKFSFTLLN